MNCSENTLPAATARELATALGVPLELLQELFLLHARQWKLEDESRDKHASAHRIASAKREIDDCNSRRYRLINAIDESVEVTPAGRPIRHYSETVGELCDRLLVLGLKQEALSNIAVGANSPDGLRDAGRNIEQVGHHLAAVVVQLVADIEVGRAMLPPRAGVKVYNGSIVSPEDHTHFH